MRSVLVANTLDAFIQGLLLITLPLYLIHKGFDVSSVAFVFSVFPLVKLIVRTYSSVFADKHASYRLFYSLASAANFFTGFFYFFANGVFLFCLGRISDAVRESFIWSVNRPSLLHAESSNSQFSLANLVSIRTFSIAIGGFLAGWFIYILGFESIFVFIMLISVAMLVYTSVMRLPQVQKPVSRKSFLEALDLAGKKSVFWKTAATMMAGGPYIVLLYLFIPILMESKGFTPELIGMLYAAYFLVFAVVSQLNTRLKPSPGLVSLFAALFYCSAVALFLFVPVSLIPVVFLFMAVGDGCGGFLWESILFRVIRESKSKATDIAVIHSANDVSYFFLLILSGFLVNFFGMGFFFALAFLAFLFYAISCARLLASPDRL